MKKEYDLAIKTGTYKNAQGEEKGRYENIGAVMTGDNGPFMFLKRTFNPAGAPFREGSESIIVSMFEPKPQQAQSAQQPAQGFDDFNDDIPF